METLSVNYVMHTLGQTGGVRVLLNFITEMSKRGHSVSITTSGYSRWYRLPPEVNVLRLPRTHFYRFMFGEMYLKPSLPRWADRWSRLWKSMPKSEINVATHAMTAYPVVMAAGQAVPVYHMQHFETLFFADPRIRSLVRATYFLPLYGIANSTWLADRLKEVTGRSVDIVTPAVEHDVFYPRTERVFGKSRITIIALGRGGFKNLDHILEAVRLCRKRVRGKVDISLRLFGQTSPHNLSKHESVRFYRRPTDDALAHLYSTSDIQVTASWAESFPLPPLEAMACGCPVIATPTGMEDYARPGVNCLLTPPGDAVSLADRIQQLIEDPSLRERLSANGISTAKSFNYADQTKILETVLRHARDVGAEQTAEQSSSLGRFHVPAF